MDLKVVSGFNYGCPTSKDWEAEMGLVKDNWNGNSVIGPKVGLRTLDNSASISNHVDPKDRPSFKKVVVNTGLKDLDFNSGKLTKGFKQKGLGEVSVEANKDGLKQKEQWSDSRSDEGLDRKIYGI